MKKEKKMFVAFWLNLCFSAFELIGGAFTGSVAILSDAVHDLGDAISIGAACLLEKHSHKHPDEKYTYGYGRFSLLGGIITTAVLLFGSAAVILGAVKRVFNPVEINYNGMIIFAVVGVCVNLAAAVITREGESVNQRAVNLHMLEDVLGWIAVLIGAAVIKLTGFDFIDALMSVVIAVFILISALKNLREITDIFLEKVPDGINIVEVEAEICQTEGVKDVHHLHIRAFSEGVYCAEMHVVTDYEDTVHLKREIRSLLEKKGITHVTVELEKSNETCELHRCGISGRICHCFHGHKH